MLKAPSKKIPLDERAYRPGGDNPRTDYNPSPFSIFPFMDSDASPAKKAVLINTTNTRVEFESDQLSTPTKKRHTTLISPSKCTLSTPEKGPHTSYVTTPKGSKLLASRMIDCDDGAMGLFISEDKVKRTVLTIPAKPSSWKSPVPKADMGGMIDIEITKKSIQDTEKLVRKRKREGLDPRGKSQNKTMGTPATTAMRKVGIDVPDGTGQHAHFIPFSFIGDKGQCVANLGIGTRYANAAMELVNPAIKRLLYKKKNALPAVYLSAIPEWVPGFEHIRLLKRITYIIKDAPGNTFKRSAKITFDMLTMERVCLTDVLPIRKFIINKFSNKPSPTSKGIHKENDDILLKPAKSITFRFNQRLKELEDSPPSSPSKNKAPTHSPRSIGILHKV